MAETDTNVFAMHLQRITLSKRKTQNNTYLILKSDGSVWMSVGEYRSHQQKMSKSVLNIEFVIWPDGFIVDRTHGLALLATD